MACAAGHGRGVASAGVPRRRPALERSGRWRAIVPELLRCLSSRFVFVVGKGGVGKTTTAAALALGMADDGDSTHLLSIDPAHSLGDVFDRPIEDGVVVNSDCAPELTLEQLDGSGEADRWFTGVREAIADLVERGTYLDGEDVAQFLDRSLPGMDEVMAALRIAELSVADTPKRIVVDTAPTGHTLRMLRSGDTVRGWVGALDAMAAKASAVGVALSGRRIRLAGEIVLEELQAEIDDFERSVRSNADFVVVTREGSVVEAETARSVARLRRDGYGVGALVGVGGGLAGLSDEGLPAFEVPLRQDLEGCEGLRAWGASTPEVTASDTRVAAPEGACEDLVSDLERRELVFFAGKGGVGKSTCAAAFALEASRRRRVLLLSVDPAGSLGDVLGVEVGSEVTTVAARLDVRQLDADIALGRFKDRHGARIKAAFRQLGVDSTMALDRRVLETFVDMAPPGVDELFALDELIDGAEDYDLIVLDTAPTGHFLRLLETPGTVLDWTRSVLRILLRYRSALAVDDLARETLDFARQLRALAERLLDPRRSAVVVVTAPGALAERETRRLIGALDTRGVGVPAVIWNRSGPSSVPGPENGPGPARQVLAPSVAPAPVGADRLEDFFGSWRCA